jgi:hypothetical protein
MLPSRIAVIGAAMTALLIGLAVGSRFSSAPPAPPAPPPVAPTNESDEIARLTRELDHERGLRGALEFELSMLRSEVGTLPTTRTPEVPDSEPAQGGDAASKRTAEAAKTPNTSSKRNEWFDVNKLTELGVDERHAEWLRERFESLQMDELYLRDQATREGSINKPRFAREVRALRDETRAAIGDEEYDSMLYASGRHNRVLLSNVLQNSPAAGAGIQAGDVLLQYDDHPIFDIRDLLAETASGEFGEAASIDVDRDGERLRFYVERGPLGARIQPLRRAPPIGP